MKILSLLFVTFLFAASQAFPGPADESNAKPGHHYHHMKMTCMGKDLIMPEGFNVSWKGCQDKIFGPFDPSKQTQRDPKDFMCVLVCHAQELDLMDDAGKLKMDEITEAISESFPKEAVTPITDKMKNCLKELGTEVKITKGDCSAIEPRFTCIKKAFMEVCMPGFVPPQNKKE